jgi:hypothetical protein
VLVVKRNQPTLHDALKLLPWREVTAPRLRARTGGRHETRSVRTLTVSDLHLDFPHVAQAAKIHTGHGPANMATLRSFAISTLRAAGRRSIAAGLCEVSYNPSPAP